MSFTVFSIIAALLKMVPGPKSTANFASGGQNPFYKKGSGLPKIFHWEGLDTLFFFVSLCVPLWLKLDGGFRMPWGS
jgi:hypothetical protein